MLKGWAHYPHKSEPCTDKTLTIEKLRVFLHINKAKKTSFNRDIYHNVCHIICSWRKCVYALGRKFLCKQTNNNALVRIFYCEVEYTFLVVTPLCTCTPLHTTTYFPCKGSSTLKKSESDVTSKWVLEKYNLLFTSSSDKDQRKKSLSLSLLLVVNGL